MFEINGNTRQLALIGDPVEHSYSPQLHNYISEKYGNNYVYTALRVTAKQLGNAMRGIRALNFAGINVTAPHKFEVMRHIDVITERAAQLGSVNTVVNRDGVLYGYNTDADGFYRSLLYEGVEVRGRDIFIVGAGGATQPIAVLFALEGAASITIQNRTRARAERLAEYVEQTTGKRIFTSRHQKHYDVVINTTSVGMHPFESECPLEDMSFIDENTAVADMIYNPAETVFLKNARLSGAKTINGLGMLIYQGIIAYELFTDTKIEDNFFGDICRDVFAVERK